jgi:hypothetical protein
VNGPLAVTKGSPDDEELAAVVIALDIVAARAAVSAPAPVSRWSSSLRAREGMSPRRDWRSRSN